MVRTTEMPRTERLRVRAASLQRLDYGAPPLGFQAGDVNLYRYVANNPTNLVDPSGLEVPGYHHFYSLFLGGSDEQTLFPLNKEEHTAAHDVLRKHGVGRTKGISYDQARANWAAKTPAQQRAIVLEAMKAANIPDPLANKYIDQVFEAAAPGTNNAAARRTPKQSQLFSRTTLEQCRKTAAFAAKYGTAVSAFGLTFFYEQAVQAGEESGVKIAERIGLGQQLKVYGDEGLLPSTSFKLEFRDRTVSVELIPDPADSKGGHFITAFYYETINQGTWGDVKVFFTWGALGQPQTIRHDIIRRSDNYKTYGFSYPQK